MPGLMRKRQHILLGEWAARVCPRTEGFDVSLAGLSLCIPCIYTHMFHGTNKVAEHRQDTKGMPALVGPSYSHCDCLDVFLVPCHIELWVCETPSPFHFCSSCLLHTLQYAFLSHYPLSVWFSKIQSFYGMVYCFLVLLDLFSLWPVISRTLGKKGM